MITSRSKALFAQARNLFYRAMKEKNRLSKEPSFKIISVILKVRGASSTPYLENDASLMASGGSRKFWWGGISSTKPQKFGCLHRD